MTTVLEIGVDVSDGAATLLLTGEVDRDIAELQSRFANIRGRCAN